MKKKKLAFTMAEVLIAIAIIGVIAALVLPVMMKNYNNRIFATKARRAYTAVVDACSHGLSDDQVKYPGDIINSYCEYIPGKSCTTGENGSITLKDGTVLTLTGWGNNPGGDLEVTIDTNDTKGPNADGKDRWYTKLTRDCKLADDGSNKTISYLKAHDWKITDDNASGNTTAQEPQSKCSFYQNYSVCKQPDGTTKYCTNWMNPSTCKTIDKQCEYYGNNYMSCPDGESQNIYAIYDGHLISTLPKNCQYYSFRDLIYCPGTNQQKIYQGYNGQLVATIDGDNCNIISNNAFLACQDKESQKLYTMYDGTLKSTLPSNCKPADNGYAHMLCPDGDKMKIYDGFNGSQTVTLPSNCSPISHNTIYMSCPDGDNQKIYNMNDGRQTATLPSNCTYLNGYMSCPDGDNQKIYETYNGRLKSTFPSNYKPVGKTSYMSYYDGTQTKVYYMEDGSEKTSYAKAGDCSIDSTGLYVCTNGNKKTYYSSYSASEGVEVDADCADPFCSNKQ